MWASSHSETASVSESTVPESSFFSSVGDDAKEALTRVFNGDGGEKFVEVVDLGGGDSGDASTPTGNDADDEQIVDKDGPEESSVEEAEEGEPPPPEASEPLGPIDINTADYDELQQITGVGPTIAGRIIDYRNENGPFYTIEEIQNVSGIGPATFEKMEDEITVGDVGPPPPEESESPPPEDEPEEEPAPPPPEPEPEPPGLININTAGHEELQGITGVGPVIAQRIIDYRNANGAFEKIEDIKNVSGIGDITFDKMKDEITI